MSSKKRIGFLAVVTALIIVIGYLIANQSQSKSPQAVVSPISSPTTSPEPKLRSTKLKLTQTSNKTVEKSTTL
jgi:hypothetical protein